ncbi:hypothetical protein LWC34_41720 [Kibdelosporangium philippinense]|uniref:Lipoprotein n=1 Tax=Kibdelosporangium philippinense TaxID=211113 RepID=A0ABS8ZNH1_9PSEU|nr:hypothetical protein [Kibdelosporangium philippinense]MCE7009289.1 hypothetical protein [Kibdelosporangium philippinense]
MIVRRVLPAVAGLLLVAGCQVPASSSNRQGPTTPSAATVAAVQWADKLCGVILEYDSADVKLEVDSTSTDAAVSSLRRSLEAMLAQVDGTLVKLGEVGQAPVAGGDEATRTLITLLQGRKEILDKSQRQLSSDLASDRTRATSVLQQIGTDLQQLKPPVNPLEGMATRFPELQAAARSADSCTEISRTRASRTALPPPSSTDEFPTTTPSFPTTTPPTGTGTGTPSSTPPPTEETTY